MASKLLVSTGYPLFTATCLKEGEIVIGGGGGASKTGVPNGLVSVLSHFLLLFNVLFFVDHCSLKTVR